MISSFSSLVRRNGVCALRQFSTRAFPSQSIKFFSIKGIRLFSSNSAPNSNDSDLTLSTDQKLDIKIPRRELLSSLDKESSQLIDNEMAKDLTEYVKDQKFRLTCDQDGHVIMKKSIEKYTVTVSFDVGIDEELQRHMAEREHQTEDADENENDDNTMNNEEIQQKSEENESEEENEEDEFRAPWHQFDVDVRIADATNAKTTTANNTADKVPKFMRISCYATSKGELEIQNVCFDENIAITSAEVPEITADQKRMDDAMAMAMREDLAMSKTIDADELSDTTYEQMFNFLRSLGVDERFPQFVQGYSEMIRNKQLQDKLGMFKRFLLH